MKFTDDAWALFRETFELNDADRVRIEQANVEPFAEVLGKAPGDQLLMIGAMTLKIAPAMAADLGLPEEFVLQHLIANSPNPARMKKAVRLARKGH